MLRKTAIALFAVASIGLLAPDVALARGGGGGGGHGGGGFGGNLFSGTVASVTPTADSVTLREHYSLVELPDNKYYIFGKDGGKRLAEEYDLPFLGQIPLVQSIREGGDNGVPVMMSDDEISKKAFMDFAGSAVRSIAMLNANMRVEKVAEVVA